MAEPTDVKGVAAGVAALAICESLLLAFADLKIMRGKDIRDALEDAAAVHRSEEPESEDVAVHREVTAIIERIMSGVKAIPNP